MRFRLLLPLAAVSLLAAVCVAFASYWQGDRWARQQIEARFASIAETLSGASYPLNQQVVDSLAGLTDTELLAVRENGSIATQSVDMNLPDVTKAIGGLNTPTDSIVDASLRLGQQDFRYGVFLRGGPAASNDDVHRVVVLFDESKLRAARMRAAALPLVTGLSTVFLLTAVALFLAQRLIGRLRRLSVQVDRIAEGQFDGDIDVGANDEIGTLGAGVRRMSGQLQQMWDSLQRTQGEKLLHQIAGGLAHQLRNSLTGARMAVELHSGKCESADDKSLQVALSQLEQTEDAVRRLLLVAAGKQDEDRPGSVLTAIEDLRGTLISTAKHLHIELAWDLDEGLQDD
ncbi:MAG: HAMP domain-containing protein, partial [Pirellulaceae bacterium]